MPVALSAGVGFQCGHDRRALEATGACLPPSRILRQVAPHQKRVQLFPAGLLVIAFAAADDGKSGPFIEPPRRLSCFPPLREIPCARRGRQDGRDASAADCATGRVPRWLASTAIDSISASSAAMRDTAKPMTLRPSLRRCTSVLRSLSMRLEFAFAPAAVKRRAVQLRQPCGIALRRGFDHRRAAAAPPCDQFEGENQAIMMRAARPAAADPSAAWRRARADRTAGPAR